ncbi:MAG: RNA methyltransferase [Saprospiraceae bacterium]|nr:RNA methyltransferase [Saprospiraceae bacterium]MCF8248867.1 RNA methyltransferase [Saprospiraceae bacterium]MCF8279592.1 RNA methyltransferase [Bacteroidales bacterium]MCF8310152.1 RNA methyltransferase [Saprospiraceae bacterium]MCF8439052.1 RNA methyltransferase [Saprospiraceae bacterium]
MKLSINHLKYFKSLHERKHRQKYHNFMVEGVKLAKEVLSSNFLEIEAVVAVPDWIAQNKALLRNIETVISVAEAELKKISLLTTPNQVVLVVKQPELILDEKSVANGISLYLDDIRDPGNLGTILRIADWFGIPWVFCSSGSVEAYNPKVVQAGMGAFLRVKCVEMDFDDLLEKLPDLPVYGTVLDGQSVFKESLEPPALIAIGNESRGLSDEIQAKLTHRISIPKGAGGGAESLNAGVATGIVCALFTQS